MFTVTTRHHHAPQRSTPHAPFRSLVSAVVGLLLCGLVISGCTRSQSIVETPAADANEGTVTQPVASSEPVVTAPATVPPSDTPTPQPTATAAPTATPLPTTQPLSATVTLAQPHLAQGQTGVIRVAANLPCAVTGHLADRTLRFVPAGEGQHMALVGIHALASAETLPLSVEVTSDDGQSLSLATAVEVVEGDYGEEVIHFDAETSQLLDPAISEPENVLMSEVWETFSPEIRWTDAFQWPVEGVFTSLFGTRRSYDGRISSYHAGLDIDGETGDPVKVAADGVVVLAEPLQVRGNVVVIDHGAGVLTGYFHLDTFDVAEGQAVKAGDVIGTMGATGLVTGSHLHWELHVGGIATSPIEWTEAAPMP